MKRVVGVCAALCAMVASVLAFGGAAGSAETSAGAPFIVGMAGAQTGFMSFYDSPVAKGAELAVAEFNKKGGVRGRPIKLVYVDGKSDPAASAAAGQQLVDAGAQAIITINDYDLGGPAARIARQNGVLSFSGAGSPKYGATGLGPLAFNINAGTPTMGGTAAKAAVLQGWKRPYLLEDTSLEFTKSLCTYFNDSWSRVAKTKIAGRDTFGQGDPSFAAQINRLKGVKPAPDVVVLCSYPPGGATLIKQLRAAGVSSPVLTFEPFDGDFWVKAVPRVSNVYHLAEGSMYGDDPRPAVNKLFKAYRAKFGSPPHGYALFGYAAIEATVKGAQQAKSTSPAAIAGALNKWKNEPTVMGPTTYTPKCHQAVGRGYPLMRWTNGKDKFVRFITPTYVPKAIC